MIVSARATGPLRGTTRTGVGSALTSSASLREGPRYCQVDIGYGGYFLDSIGLGPYSQVSMARANLKPILFLAARVFVR
jgi:hypothetical protein